MLHLHRPSASRPAETVATLVLAAWALGAATVPPRYAARQTGEIVRLSDSKSQTMVSIIPGVGNQAIEMKVKGHNVLYFPHASIENFKAKPGGVGIPLLAPWANRLDEPAFYANGKKYAFDMELGNVRGPIPIHGFLQTTNQWQVVETQADGQSARVTSRLEFSRQPEWIKQWPFAHTIEMTHIVRDGVLEVRTRIINLSGDPMPVAVGFHPYFQLTDSPRDAWTISVGARTRWLLAANKVPTGEVEAIDKLIPAPKVALKDYNLDDVFGDLVRDAQGRATMSVAGKTQRLDMIQGPNFRSTVIYAPAGRDFICFEPMAGITNALNLGHKGLYKELQSIPAGGVWQESFWIKPSGFQ